MTDDFDVVDLLRLLADRCVEVLDAQAAGIMLAAPNGRLRVMASSSEAMRILEVFENRTPSDGLERWARRVSRDSLACGDALSSAFGYDLTIS